MNLDANNKDGKTSDQVQSIKDVIKAAMDKFPTLANKQMKLIITGAVFGSEFERNKHS
jgi:hypothetical protein